MKYIQIAHWKRRPLIYATILSFGYLINFGFLQNAESTFFFLASIVLYILLLVELFVTSDFYHVHHKKNSKTLYEFEHHKTVQYIHHLLLPSLTFWSFVLFAYFNDTKAVLGLLFILFFICTAVLFENIHSFYRHQFSLNKHTNYIYDFISIILMFLIADISIDLTVYYGWNNFVIPVIVGFFLFLLGFISLLRQAFSREFLGILICLVTLFIPIAYLLLETNIPIFTFAALSAMVFYIFDSFLDHYVERSLKKEVIVEYFLVLLLILALLNLIES